MGWDGMGWDEMMGCVVSSGLYATWSWSQPEMMSRAQNLMKTSSDRETSSSQLTGVTTQKMISGLSGQIADRGEKSVLNAVVCVTQCVLIIGCQLLKKNS